MTDFRSVGITNLRYYSSASMLPSLSALIKHLDDNYGPTAIESIGRLAYPAKQAAVKASLAKLAKQKGLQYPSMAELRSALFEAGSTGPSAAKIVGDATLAAGKQIANASLFGLSLGLGVLLIAGVSYLAWQSGAFKNAKRAA